MTEPLVIPSTTRRDILIGVAAAAGVVGLILLAFFWISGVKGKGWMRGVIVEKVFEPVSETRLIVSRKGARRQEVTGHHFFRVRVPKENDELYDVVVDERVYKRHKVGDEFSFPKPPSG